MKTRKGYLVKRGRTYYAEWTISGKKYRQSTRQTDKDEACKELSRIMKPFLVVDDVRTLETVKARIEGAKAELVILDEERNPPLSFGQAWTAFLQASNRPDSGHRTLSDYEGYFTAFWNWLQENNKGVQQLREVTPSISSEYTAHLRNRGLKAGTYNKHLNALGLVFRILSESAKLTMNPWEGIRRKRSIPQSRRELTIDELRQVCAKAKGELQIILAIGIYTGFRLGDAVTLRWGEVDLKRGIIRRIPAKTARRNPKPVLVPIHPTLQAILDEIPLSNRKEYVIPEMATTHLRDSSAISKRIQAHIIDCDISTAKPETGFKIEIDENGKRKMVHTGKRAVLEVGFHSLRHSFVSMCRAANAPLSVVESIVGHSSPAMTRYYTHTGDLAALAAVSALPALIGEDIKALPLPQSPRLIEASAIRGIAGDLNCANWQAVKELLLKLADAPAA